jgi:nitrite reductase (NADH) small subunit
MAFAKSCSLATLQPGDLTEVMAGEIPIAVCNVAGEIRALGGICPHQGGPLGHGAMNGEYVVCPWHAWEFNSLSGELDFNPDIRVATYPVRVDGDDILVDPGA